MLLGAAHGRCSSLSPEARWGTWFSVVAFPVPSRLISGLGSRRARRRRPGCPDVGGQVRRAPEEEAARRSVLGGGGLRSASLHLVLQGRQGQQVYSLLGGLQRRAGGKHAFPGSVCLAEKHLGFSPPGTGTDVPNGAAGTGHA